MKKKYKQLSQEDRDLISIMKSQGKISSEIGQELKRDPSTIRRELKRNMHEGRVYLPCHAHGQTLLRRHESRKCGHLRDQIIKDFVKERLSIGWSPELIAGRLTGEHPDKSISHETIYTWIYKEAPQYIEKLARSHTNRRKHRRGNKHRFMVLPFRTSISKRPKTVGNRKRVGDWEVDVMRCAEGFIMQVLVERKTKYTKLTQLHKRKSRYMHDALIKQMGLLDKKLRRTITYDNGSENTYHWKTDRVLKTKSFFCHPYCGWEKGTVENTIGLARRFLPKNKPKSEIKNSDIEYVENWLNHRPRKCLNFLTPYEAMQKETCT